MINPLNNNITENVLDFEVLTGQIIPLELEHYNQAIEISKQVPTKALQWQTYLNVLALSAIDEWLKERAGDIRIDKAQCSGLQPLYANVIEAVCNLKIGEFKLCLIATESLIDEVIRVPRVVLDLPEFVAHFYIVIQVLEEEEQASIQGFLSYTQLQKAQKYGNLNFNQELWSYELPLDWLDINLNHLLFCLRLVSASSFNLPKTLVNKTKLCDMNKILKDLLPQLQSPDAEICKILNWEQAVALYTSPELIKHFYDLQSRSLIIADCSKEPQAFLPQQAINVGLWFQNQIDELAESISLIMLPPFNPAMRSSSVGEKKSPDKEFECIFSDLVYKKKIEIFPPVSNAYTELSLGRIRLQLCIVIWPLWFQVNEANSREIKLEKPQEQPWEWHLLLILKPQPGTKLPDGIKLQVSNQIDYYDEKEFTGGDYLYFPVMASYNEKLLVTIALKNGEMLPLPPFEFILN
jgi:Protein of unknown function (DUF1822)